jgi:hypothetical protein
MSAPAVNPSLFPRVLPDAMDTIIVPFCDLQTLSQMQRVCRSWNRNQEVAKVAFENWENRWCASTGYPVSLLTVFRRCRRSIYHLPELDFEQVKEEFRERIRQNERFGRDCFDGVHGIAIGLDDTPVLSNDYVDFLNSRLLSGPTMRFTHNGRAGLVMCLQDQRTHAIGICTLFRRLPTEDSWVEAPVQHNDRRIPFPDCVWPHNNFTSLERILQDAHPDVRLIAPPPVVPPAPGILPIAQLDRPNIIHRTISFLFTVICGFFSWLYGLFHRQ